VKWPPRTGDIQMAGEEAKSYLAEMTKRFNAGYAKVYDEL
jgi:hypothetical protein